ncbi:MAG: amidohydrolase family protein [Verrucomicrobia bacterium]|nr:amidohydrolase family protein [Verrucomicrobiota bacterium]
MPPPLLIRARFVLPVVRPPIENGAIAVAGGRVRAVGSWPDMARQVRGTVVDLGDSVVLPGLVNAHCHLEYTGLAGKIPPPRQFVDWLQAIVALKTSMTPDDCRRSWDEGAAMLLRSGTTTVADVTAFPALLPHAWSRTPLRAMAFRELIALQPGPPATRTLHTTVDEITGWPGAEGRVGLSPHAPYSTTLQLLRQANRAARVHRWRLVIHVAESAEEFDMFMRRRGPLREWLEPRRDMSDCGLGSPVQHLARAGCLNRRLLAVHANYLAPDDAPTLGRHHVNVVHCPRSHAYFAHRRFPLASLAAHGVNLCLGTDSLATTLPTLPAPLSLDLFAEMRALARSEPGLAPAILLRMATANGARALGRERQIGELWPGAHADAIAVPLRGATDAHEAIVQHAGPVLASLIGGTWAVPPPASATRPRQRRKTFPTHPRPPVPNPQSTHA